MNKTNISLYLTLSTESGWEWVTRVWLYEYDAKRRQGHWALEDTDFLNLLAWERGGRFKVVGDASKWSVNCCDRSDDRPAFVLYNAPYNFYNKLRVATAPGLITNPRNPVGLTHDLEWVVGKL